MLLSERRRDPHDRRGCRACCVGQDLPKVRMVSGLELVLDDQHGIVREVTADKVELVAAYGCPELQVDAECFGEPVLILQEPGRERVCLMRPNEARIDRLEPAELNRHVSILSRTAPERGSDNAPAAVPMPSGRRHRRCASADVFDDLDELVDAVALTAGELDEFACSLNYGAALRSA